MKTTKKILALLLAVVMMLTLFVGCGKKAEEAEQGSEVFTGHHTNAHDLPSFSIHYTDTADGPVYDYMNEAGETVSVTQEEVDVLLDTVIATCGDYTLTNRDLAYYYQEQYYQFYQVYGFYMMLLMDTTKGLDEQLGTDGAHTWQYMFAEAGVNMFHSMSAATMEAIANDFDMTEAEQIVENVRIDVEESAAQVGYTDLDAFVVDYFGPGATLDSYLEFSRINAIANAYANYLKELVEVDEGEIDAYWAENEESLTQSGIQKIDKNVVDVRHILVEVEKTTDEEGNEVATDEAWAAAEAEANEIYNAWLSGEATEDSFAALATERTDDAGSAETGGLYEDVHPGQMVEEFDAWCFDDSRQVGDTAIVKTTFGYHIMFFSGEGDYIYWRNEVESAIRTSAVNKQLEAMAEKYPMESDLNKAVLMDSTAPSVPTAEEETAEDAVVEEHVHTEGDGHNH